MENISKDKTKVITFPNEYGTDQFGNYFKELGEKSKKDEQSYVRFGFLLKALDYMQTIGFNKLPKGSADRFFAELDIEINGKVYEQTFELIKPLKKENIYELRINIKKYNWRFRGIFFPYTYKKTHFYCFVYPFEKKRQITFNLTDTYREIRLITYYVIYKTIRKNMRNGFLFTKPNP